MRSFSPSYLADTRAGMWETREALDSLDLAGRDRIIDVGCGTGEFTDVLVEESSAQVVAVDGDSAVLAVGSHGERVCADAYQLPFRADTADLVVCQALLVNVLDPMAIVGEFDRVSSELVAVIEPDNSGVTIKSTVQDESELAERARSAFIDGIESDITLGDEAVSLFESVGLTGCSTARYVHERQIAPPYGSDELNGAIRKANGARLTTHRETLLKSELTVGEFDALRAAWRAVGRKAVRQMESEEYIRIESIPFYVTVGRVVR